MPAGFASPSGVWFIGEGRLGGTCLGDAGVASATLNGGAAWETSAFSDASPTSYFVDLEVIGVDSAPHPTNRAHSPKVLKDRPQRLSDDAVVKLNDMRLPH
jgi:hypothetical protein